jgi:hypothetical protein
MPISEVLLRGSAPNILMSRAESHDVGGGGSPGRDIEGEGGSGLEGIASKESGVGEGDCLSLSLNDIVWLVRTKQQSTTIYPCPFPYFSL